MQVGRNLDKGREVASVLKSLPNTDLPKSSKNDLYTSLFSRNPMIDPLFDLEKSFRGAGGYSESLIARWNFSVIEEKKARNIDRYHQRE